MKTQKKRTRQEILEDIGMYVLYPLILLFEQVGKSVKFLNTRKRQIIASVLTVCMLLTMIPVMSLTAFAETASSQLPDTTMFVTKEQLMTFNTDDTDGTISSAKVYFGSNNHKWWIAGSQNADSIVLFAASPLGEMVNFDVYYDEDMYDKTYPSDANCSYVTTPSTVYTNHYGSSNIRKVLKELETSYFSAAEQVLMNDTIIYTDDMRNNCTYTTTDVLYLAYGEYSNNPYITVGKNSTDLNSGLKVQNSYWPEDGFDLRTPHRHMSFYVVVFVRKDSSYASYSFVESDTPVVPAFELNLSSVLFGSAAKAATSSVSAGGQLEAAANEFVLRYSGSSIGTATVNSAKDSISIAGAGENTYLVVQNSDGAWAKKVTDGDTVSASTVSTDGINSLPSFENCKVWLETTGEDRITYASEAEHIQNVAKVEIGDEVTYHASLADAVSKIGTGTGTITLLADVTTGGIYADKGGNITLDLNGKNLSSGPTVNNKGADTVHVIYSSTLTIKGDGNVTKETNSTNALLWVSNGGKLVIEGGTYSSTESVRTWGAALGWVGTSGSVEIRGGTFHCDDTNASLHNGDYSNDIGPNALFRAANGTTISISGGTFYTKNDDSILFRADNGGKVTVSGGSYPNGFTAHSGNTVAQMLATGYGFYVGDSTAPVTDAATLNGTEVAGNVSIKTVAFYFETNLPSESMVD